MDAQLFDDLEDVSLGVELALGVFLKPVFAPDVHATAAAVGLVESLDYVSSPVAVAEMLALQNCFLDHLVIFRFTICRLLAIISKQLALINNRVLKSSLFLVRAFDTLS